MPPLPCPFNLSLAQPRISGCPPDGSFLMFIGGGLPNGIGFATFAQVKQCILNEIVGPGAFTINGTQLNGSQEYIDTDLDGYSLVIYYNGIGFLNYGTQWAYVTGGGFKILIPGPFTIEDKFIVFPSGIGQPIVGDLTFDTFSDLATHLFGNGIPQTAIVVNDERTGLTNQMYQWSGTQILYIASVEI